MRDDEQSRERILNAALEVFREYGPVKATIADVARQAGISKSLVYYYFKDKNELFRAVVLRMDRKFLDGLKERIMQEKTASSMMRTLLTQRFEHLTRAAARRKVSLERSLEYYPLFHSLMDLFLDGEKALLTEVLDLGVKNGEFCLENIGLWAKQMAVMMLSMDQYIFMQTQGRGMDMEAWNMVIDTIVRGLQCGK